MTSRLLTLAIPATLALGTLVAAAPAAQAADDCHVVASATAETDGASYRGGADDGWHTYYRMITSTTTLCGDTYSTELTKGPWLARQGTAEADNPGFAHEKALQLEVDRLQKVVQRLTQRVERLRARLGTF